MESAYILSRFNFCIIITLAPFQIAPFLGIQNLDNGVLVQRPTIHIRVKSQLIHRPK